MGFNPFEQIGSAAADAGKFLQDRGNDIAKAASEGVNAVAKGAAEGADAVAKAASEGAEAAAKAVTSGANQVAEAAAKGADAAVKIAGAGAGQFGNAAADAGNKVAEEILGAAGAIGEGAFRLGASAVDTGSKAVEAGVSAIQTGAKKVHQAFGGEYGDEFESTLRDENGNLIVPEQIVDEREFNEIAVLASRYEKVIAPGRLAKMGKRATEIAPAPVKELASKASDVARDTINGLTESELMASAVKKAAEGFGGLEKHAAKASVSREYVISRINEGGQNQKISCLSEICLLRAYDIAAIADKEKFQHMGIAFVEGGGLGAVGFWGLPANLALSMLIYFRAVQSVAMFYGYDVKENPDELVIASEVFSKAMSPSQSNNPANDYVGKVLVYTEIAGIKKAAAKTWTSMIDKGGAALILAQMRALSNSAARKALEKAGKKGIEAGVFTKTLAQIGEKLTLKNITKMIPFVGAGFGALFDTAQMNRVIEIANLFYHKRFILEKEDRIRQLEEEGVAAGCLPSVKELCADGELGIETPNSL